MNTNFISFWGIDVSKEWVDIAIDKTVTRVKQNKRDLSTFIKSQTSFNTDTLAILESTGGYERQFAELLDEANVTVHIAHPNKVRNYAKAKGVAAKTDKLDALILADYGRFIDPDTIRRLPSKIERKLRDFSSRLSQLKLMHHQEYCRMGLSTSKWMEQSHQKMIKLINKELTETEEQMIRLVNQDEYLIKRFQLLQTMKGVGPKIALALISELPELGEANKKEISALIGVAPINQDSGKRHMKARVCHGRDDGKKYAFYGSLECY